MKQYSNIDEYIQIFPKDVQFKLQKLREIIHQAAPEAIEDIRYQMPTFRLKNKNLVHFAAFKGHIGFYPTPTGNALKELEPYRTGKGTSQFPINEPIPYTLVEHVVKYRVKEILKQFK